MKNFAVILKEQSSRDSVVRLIESFGGHWRQTRPDFDEGVIDDGKVFILVDYCVDIRQGQGYLEGDVAQFRERLGVEPRVALMFAVRRNEASDTFAKRIAEEAITQWGGVVDDDEL